MTKKTGCEGEAEMSCLIHMPTYDSGGVVWLPCLLVPYLYGGVASLPSVPENVNYVTGWEESG